MAAQLDIITDTDLRNDPRLAVMHSGSSSLATPSRKASEHSGSSNVTARRSRATQHSGSSSVDPRIVTIDRRRRAALISHAGLCRLADVELNNWHKLLRGEHQASASTLAKLQAALEAPREIKPPQVIAGFHRLVMQIIAMQMAFDVPALLATDFSKQRPGNPQWLRAARIRQMASYITAVELEVSNADLGRAIGDTRANIKYARDAIEDLREEGSEIDRVLSAVSLQVKGEG